MSNKHPEIRESLPRHSDGSEGAGWTALLVEGQVRQPLSLNREELAGLPRLRLSQDFRCEEGWIVPDLDWEGVPVSALLDQAGPLPEAGYVTFQAGEYRVSLTLAEALAPDVLLALGLNGEPLPLEHGGPCRLVAPDKVCYFSVKWVERITLAAERPQDTGREIAQARNRRNAES
ncbi:MAG: molybdopterin-dependent oxidoreductase [Dehalococcoidia bacterium]